MRATPDEPRPACSPFPTPAGGITVLVLGWLISVAPLTAQLVIDANTSSYSNSSYSGTITVRGATLSLATGNALGNGAIVEVESDGILDITSEAEKFGNLSGDGAVILGTSTLEIMANSQDSSFTGALDGAGTFLISTDASADDTFTLGTEKISTGYTSDSYAYTGTFNIADANLALHTTGTDDRLTNTFIGPGDIRKTGAGTLTFGDDQTSVTAMLSGHTGALEIAEGILALDTSDGAYALSHDYLKGAGTLGIKGSDGNSNAVTLSGDWDAFGDFTGNIHIFADGRLIAGADDSLGDGNAVHVDAGGQLQLDAAEGFGSLSGTGEVKFGSHELLVGADNDSAVFAGELSGSADVTKNGSGTWTLGDAVRAPSAVLNGHTGNLIVAAGTFAFDTSHTDDQVDHIISGAGGIAKVGANTLTLSAANSYTGGTTISAGTLSIGQASHLGASTSDLTFDGGTLAVTDTVTLGTNRAVTVTANNGTVDTGSHTLSINGVISGATTAQLTKTGSGTLLIDGTNTFAGTFDVDAGTLAIGTGNTLSADAIVDLATGTILDLTAEDEDFGNLTGAGTVNLGSRTIGIGFNDADATFAGVITGTGGLEKSGAGTLTLTAANTYTGNTAITGGTLALAGGDERIADTSVVSVSSGATFALGSTSETIGGLSGGGTVDFGTGDLILDTPTGTSATFSGGFIRASGSNLEKTGAGTQYITGDITGIDGTTVINGGTLSLGNGGVSGYLSSYIVINAAGNLTFDQSRNLSLGTGWLSGTGTLTKEGSGNLTLFGSTGHTGPVIINDGTVTLNSRTAIESVSPVTVNSGGILQLNGQSVELASLDGDGAILFSDNVNDFYRDSYVLPLKLTVGGNNADSVFTGGIASKYWTYSDGSTFEVVNSGTFEKVGTGTLEIDTEEFGATLINIEAGTLKLGTGNVLENDQRVSLSSGATLDITAEGESFGGLEGTGGMVRMGASNLTVGGDNTARTYAGGLNNFTDANDDTLAASPGDFIKTGTQLFTIEGDLATNLANFTGDFEIQDGGLALSPSSGVTYTLAGSRLRGTGNLRQSGAGTLTIVDGPNDLSGNFVVLDGSTLDFAVSAATTIAIASDRLVGAGLLQKSGDGTLTLNGGDGGFTGDIAVTGGTLQTGGGGNSLGDDTSIDLVSGASLVLTGDELFGGITGDGEVDLAGFEMGVGYDNASSALFTGSITSTGGGGNFIKAGTGHLTLSGTSTYTGGTTINDGTLTLGHATDTLWDAGAITINNDATLGVSTLDTVGAVTLNEGTIAGSGTLTASSYAVKFGTISAQLGGSGALTKTSSGTVTLSGANSGFSGGTTVSAGTLQTGNADALGTGAVTVSGGTLDLGGNTDTVGQVTLTSGTITNGTLSSSAGFDVRSGTISGNFAGSGGLTKSTSGTVTLSGNNSYTGDTTVDDGTLQLGGVGASASSSNLVINSGTFDVNGFLNQVGSIAGTGGTLDLGSGTLFTSTSANTTFHGNVTGSGTLQKLGGGTLTLAGENDLTGTLDIQAGTVALGSIDNNALGGSATVNVGSNGTFDVAGQTEGFGTLTGSGTVEFGSDPDRFLAVSGGSFTGTFDGAGEFRHAGSGTYTLSTAKLAAFSGKLVSESGTLALDTGSGTHTLANAITGSGNLEKTGAGTLTLSGLTTAGFTGNYAITAGTLALDTSSHDLTITHDDLSGLAAATLEKVGTGTLTLSGDWDTGDDFESAIAVSAGTLAFGTGDVLSNSTVVTLTGGATLDLSAEGENFGNLTGGGSVTLGAENIGLGYNDAASTFSGNLSGTGGTLTKSGSAMLTLSGINTYTGGTSIEAGTLRVSGGRALADNGTVDLATNEATLDLNGSDETIGALTGGGGDAGDVTLGSGTLTVGTSSDFAFDGEIGVATDTGGLTKVGSGNFTLNGTARYSGATTINGGTLTLGNATNTLRANSAISINNGSTLAIGANSDTVGAITLNSGSITGSTGVLTSSSYAVESGTISAKLGTGTLTKTTGGTVTLSGDNALTTVNIEAGTLAFGSGDILDNSAIVNLTGGTLDITAGGEQIGNLSGTGGTVALGTQRLTVGLNDLTSTFTGGLSGSGELRKAGTSTFTLGTGGITAFTGSIDLATDGLALSSANGANDIFGGTLSGAGNLTKSGAGTLVLTGDNTYAGGTILAEGTLKVGSAGALGSTGTLTFTGGTLQYGSANQTDYSNRFSNAANQAFAIDTHGQTVTFASNLGSTDATLTKSGAGTLILAADTKLATTTVNGGTLRLGHGSNSLPDSSALIVAGGTFDLATYSEKVGTVTLESGNIIGSGTLTSDTAFNVQSGTIAANLAGSADLTKTTTSVVTLSGTNNTYSGDTLVQAGVLRLGAAGALSPNTTLTVSPGAKFEANGHAAAFRQLEGTGDIDVGSGGLTVTPDAGTNTFSGRLTGTGGLTKEGTGTLELTGTQTYTGTTAINAGRLKLTGSAADSAFTINNGGTLAGTGTLGALTLNDGGILSPGNSPGTLSVGNTVWNGGGEFVFEINDATGIVGTSWDLLDITGSLTLNATGETPFSINLDTLTAGNVAGAMDHFDANTNYSWTFVSTTGGITFGDGASIGGSFSLDTSGFAHTTNGTFAVAQVGNNLALTYTSLSAVPEPSTYALLLGMVIFGYVSYQRRLVRHSR